MQLKIVPDVIKGQEIAILEPTATVRDAAGLMADRQLGGVVIAQSGRLKGIFTERDASYRVVAAGLDPLTTQLLEVMTADPVTLSPDDTVLGALQHIQASNYRHLPVLNGDQLLGVVSVRNIMACVKAQRENDFRHLKTDIVLGCRIVPDLIEDQNMATLEPIAMVREAAQLMATRRIGAVLVTHKGSLKGIFTERDVSLRVIASDLNPDTTPLVDVMTLDPVTLKPDDKAYDALQSMLAGDYRHVPVIDKTHLVGIVSIRDIYGCVEAQLEEEFRRALLDRARNMAGDDI
jgi:CBS domain-containing protein